MKRNCESCGTTPNTPTRVSWRERERDEKERSHQRCEETMAETFPN